MNKKKIFWAVFSVLIAGLSIWAVTSQSKEFSGKNFLAFVKQASPGWFLAAVVCMFGFIFFEGAALLCIVKAFGYPRKGGEGFVYSAADIYFSAITPSATGGQPASAYFMMKDGIPGAVVTVALLVNLVMYTAAILCVGLLCLIFRPVVFLHFNLLSRLLIGIGYVVLLGLGLFFLLLLRRASLLYAICDWCIRLLHKLHLVRHPGRKQEKLKKLVDDFKQCTQMIEGQKGMLVKTFIYNFFQRASQIAVTVMAFLATGGEPQKALDIWITQSFVAIGSNCVPIPGAMGVADYLLLDGFSELMTEAYATNLELLSRSISFYSCIVISGVAVVAGYLIRRMRRSKK